MKNLTVSDVRALPFDYLPILLNERQEKIEEQAAEIEKLKEESEVLNEKIEKMKEFLPNVPPWVETTDKDIFGH
jgi:hypothetical protein